MCEIDVTDLVLRDFVYFYCAGPMAWENAMERADDALLATEDQLQALRDWAQSSGGWDAAEIAGWSDTECNALFIQLVSSDWKELESLAGDDDNGINWQEAQRLAEAGTLGCCLYQDDDGRVYYYLG